MKLQTKIPLTKASDSIDYKSQLVLLGSCFVENMGKKLDYYKFRQLQNPFGILFHPLAIEKLIARSVQKKTYSESDIFHHNERWHCFDAHSDVSDTSKENLLNTLNDTLKKTSSQIATASHIIITLGTAWAYHHTTSGKIVANCHKVPQREFTKKLLAVEDIVGSLQHTIGLAQSVNKDAQFIFTVSPVRHLKDGFIENQRSKAHLIAAIHQVVHTSYLVPYTSYFPSYEIMMDELRDYRFYRPDMVHPSQLAIDYIWEKFKQVWISEDVDATMEEISDIQKGLSHRPFNPDSKQHRKFLESLESKIARIRQEYPFMEF